MRIDINPITSDENNEFSILYNNDLEYKAILPPVSLKDPLNVDKIRNISLYNHNDILEYETSCDHISGEGDDIPLKYSVTDIEKFNQIRFTSFNNMYIVSYDDDPTYTRYILNHNDKLFYIYQIEEGDIRHILIYDHDNQIGEAINLVKAKLGNDEYRCFINDDYCYIADGITCLLLFLDRNEYSSSYDVDGISPLKREMYSKNMKYYKRGWLKENFADAFPKNEKADEDEEERKPIVITKEEQPEKGPNKNFIIILGVIWIIAILALIITVLFVI